MVQLAMHARGVGGVEEMVRHMDDGAVLFGLLRFAFGHGPFARVKYVRVHLQGELCPAVMRGRLNGMKAQAAKGACRACVPLPSTALLNIHAIARRAPFTTHAVGPVGLCAHTQRAVFLFHHWWTL